MKQSAVKRSEEITRIGRKIVQLKGRKAFLEKHKGKKPRKGAKFIIHLPFKFGAFVRLGVFMQVEMSGIARMKFDGKVLLVPFDCLLPVTKETRKKAIKALQSDIDRDQESMLRCKRAIAETRTMIRKIEREPETFEVES